MCVVSYVGDQWQTYPPPSVGPFQPYIQPTVIVGPPEVTREEFDALRKDLEALRKLLIAAKIYDEETGQPDCEVDEKVALIKRLAELVGVDFSDVFDE